MSNISEKKLVAVIKCVQARVRALEESPSPVIPGNIVTSSPTYNLPTGTNYVSFVGNQESIWTLPELNTSAGTRLILTNQGTEAVAIMSHFGGNDIYLSSGNTNMAVLDIGVTFIFYNNGLNFSNIQ